MKIAEGYNPDRVTTEQLTPGYRTVPRKYLKGDHDLDGVAEVWDGSSWDKVLIWADDTDTHRTTLTNAQLGLRKKAVTVDLEQNATGGLVPPAGDKITVKRNTSGIWTIGVDPSPEPVWRNITEAEREILRAASGRNAAFNWTRFRYYGMDNPNCDFSDPRSAYSTTLTPDEILAYAFRPITEDKLENVRANRERVDLTKFRHLGGKLAEYASFGCPPEHYSTSMTPEEIADLKWRDLSEAERTALRALSNTPRSQFSNLHFRHDGIKPWYVGTCIFAPEPALRYQTDLAEAEVAALVKPPETKYRQLTADEMKVLRGVAGPPVEFRAVGVWAPVNPPQALLFSGKVDAYRTSLTPDEMAKWIAEHCPKPPTGTPATKAEAKQLDASLWRPITEDERKKLHDTKTRLDYSKFKWGSRDSGQWLSFSDPANCYTTILTPAELAKLTEVWRPLSLAEVKIMRRAKGYDPSRFRCDLGSAKDHSFKTWDFRGAVATNYQTTYSEQEIADLL